MVGHRSTAVRLKRHMLQRCSVRLSRGRFRKRHESVETKPRTDARWYQCQPARRTFATSVETPRLCTDALVGTNVSQHADVCYVRRNRSSVLGRRVRSSTSNRQTTNCIRARTSDVRTVKRIRACTSDVRVRNRQTTNCIRSVESTSSRTNGVSTTNGSLIRVAYLYLIPAHYGWTR